MYQPRLARLGLVVLLFVAGCTDGGDPTAPFDPSDPLHAVFDGSHDGLEGFNFLPPMVKDPAYSGTFDPGLSPVVEVCATVTCDALHSSYSMTEGTGSERVRLVEQDEHYIVNWNTQETGAASGQTYRVRVVVSGVVLGYADVAVVSTGREAVEVRSDGLIALVANQTLPVKFRIETGIPGTVVISPSEATINVGATQQFSAALYDLHGELLVGPTITWSSGDMDVADVDGDGLATGVSIGEAVITASAGPSSGTAKLTVSGAAVSDLFVPLSRSEIVALEPLMSISRIDNSDGNRIPVGAVMAYRTSDGMYGKLVVLDSNPANNSMTIRHETYQNDGSILISVEQFVIRGTWAYSLTLGTDQVGAWGGDLWLDNQTSTERYFTPRNGAAFTLIGIDAAVD